MDPSKTLLGRTLLEDVTPLVMVLRTPLVEEACQKNGLNFVQMLHPFCLFNKIDVPVRTVSDQSYRLQMFNLRLAYASDVRRQNFEVAEEHLKQVASLASEEALPDLLSEPPQLENVLNMAESKSVPSWFHTFNKELIHSISFSEDETFDHPVACLFVVSSKDSQPINTFVDLFNTNQLPSLLNDGAMDPKILKYYLLVHDNQDGPSEKAINILSEMRSTFGSSDCRLLCINSVEEGVAQRDDNPWAPYKNDVSLGQNIGCFLDINDLNELRDLMLDLSSKHIIPYMEQKIRVLNHQVSATRKGFRNQIKNLWWRKGKEDTPDAPSGPMYTFSSIESQIRVLGDYAFMLRDYELALSNYRLLSTDYKLDKAWKRYAGVQEMIGLSYFMLDQSRKDAEYCMENAFSTYLRMGSSGQRNATRCGLWWAEMLKAWGQFKEAAGVYFRISNEEPPLHAAVMLEQSSYCYLYSNPPMMRKYGFHLVLAGSRYEICSQRKHAIRTYKNALSVYKGSVWSYINDHVQFNIGRWYSLLGIFDVAIKHMLEILACPHQPISTQEFFLKNFLHVVQNLGKMYEVFRLQLPVINMRSLNVMFEDHRTYASSDAVHIKESLWQTLEEEMVPSMSTIRTNWLDSQPKSLKKYKDFSTCVAGGQMLMDDHPTLFWTPCAAHCIDLMLHDICKLPIITTTVKRAIALNGYIYNHPYVLNMMRTFTEQKELIRPGVTRFATVFLTLQSIYNQKNKLRRMFTSEEWSTSRYHRDTKGKDAYETVLSPGFWNNILYSLRATGPLVRVLRMVDSEKKPAMGYIYEAMDRAKEAISKSFNYNEAKYYEIWEIIDKRWNDQLHRPLHAAGYYLNPEYCYTTPRIESNEELNDGFLKTMARLVPDEGIQHLVETELSLYRYAQGVMGSPNAIRNRALWSPEPIKVDLEFRNPLQTLISVSGVSLVCELSPASAATGSGDVHANNAEEHNLETGSHESVNLNDSNTLAYEREKDLGIGTSFILSELDFTLQGGETSVVQLNVTPKVEGLLKIVGVRWTFSGSIVGYCNFDSDLAKKKPTKRRNAGPSSRRNLNFVVIKNLPKLEGSINQLPPKTYTGDLRRLVLELRNESEYSIKNLKMRISHPRFLIPGSLKDMDADFPGCLEKRVNCEHGDMQTSYLNKSKGSLFSFPKDTVIRGETTFLWPLWLHTGVSGSISLYISIYYEMENCSSEMSYRTLRMHYKLEVFPSLDISFHVTPCLSRLQEFLVRMDIINRAITESFSLRQLSAVGHQWKISSLLADVSICPSKLLQAGQTLSCFFRLKDCSSGGTTSSFSELLGCDVKLGPLENHDELLSISCSPLVDFHHQERLEQETDQDCQSTVDFVLISEPQENSDSFDPRGLSDLSQLFSHHACLCSITSKNPLRWLVDGPHTVYHDFISSFCEIKLRMTIHNCSDAVASVKIHTFDVLPDRLEQSSDFSSSGGNQTVGWHDISLADDGKVLSDVQITRRTKMSPSPDVVSSFVWCAASSTRLALEPFSTTEVPLQVCVFSPGTLDLSSYELHWSLKLSDDRVSTQKDAVRRSSGTCTGHPYYLTLLQAQSP